MTVKKFAAAFKKLALEDRRVSGESKEVLERISDELVERAREHSDLRQHVRKELTRGAYLTKHRFTL